MSTDCCSCLSLERMVSSESAAPSPVVSMQQFSKHPSHLSHVPFQVHVHALSSFAKMSLNVFPSKGQKCIHAYIESTFRVLEERDRVQSYQGRLAKSSRRRQPEEEVNGKGQPPQRATVTLA